MHAMADAILYLLIFQLKKKTNREKQNNHLTKCNGYASIYLRKKNALTDIENYVNMRILSSSSFGGK